MFDRLLHLHDLNYKLISEIRSFIKQTYCKKVYFLFSSLLQFVVDFVDCD